MKNKIRISYRIELLIEEMETIIDVLHLPDVKNNRLLIANYLKRIEEIQLEIKDLKIECIRNNGYSSTEHVDLSIPIS